MALPFLQRIRPLLELVLLQMIRILLLQHIQWSKLKTGNMCCQRNKKTWCGKLFHEALMAHHRAFICYQEYAIENNKQSNRGRVRMLGWMFLSRWMTGSLGRRIQFKPCLLYTSPSPRDRG